MLATFVLAGAHEGWVVTRRCALFAPSLTRLFVPLLPMRPSMKFFEAVPEPPIIFIPFSRREEGTRAPCICGCDFCGCEGNYRSWLAVVVD